MSEENLEEMKPKEEADKPTPEVEGEEPTTPEKELTLGKSFTQKELDEAVGKGLSSVQSQLTLAKTGEEKAKAQISSIQAELKFLQGAHDKLMEEKFEDDPEALKGYRHTKAIEAKEKAIAAKEAELEVKGIEQENTAWAIRMQAKAKEVQGEYAVPDDVLDLCRTEKEVEAVAKHFPKVGGKSEEETKPKFDKGVSSAGAGTGAWTMDKIRDMDAKEWQKHEAEVLEASRQGKIK